jgi:hypothetical protein
VSGGAEGICPPDPLHAMQFRPARPPQVSGVRPALRPSPSDRGCPLDTARARCLWHAGGTAGEDDRASYLAAVGPAHAMGEAVQDDHRPRWQAATGGAAGGAEFRACGLACQGGLAFGVERGRDGGKGRPGRPTLADRAWVCALRRAGTNPPSEVSDRGSRRQTSPPARPPTRRLPASWRGTLSGSVPPGSASTHSLVGLLGLIGTPGPPSCLAC